MAHPPAPRPTNAVAILRFLPVIVILGGIVFAPHRARATCGGWVSWTDESSISSRLDRFVVSWIASNGDERGLTGRENAASPIAPKRPSPCELGLCSKAPDGPFAPPRVARASNDSWIAFSVDPISVEPRSTPIFLEPIGDPPRHIPDSIDRPPRRPEFSI